MLQLLTLNKFELVEETSQFNGDFIKNHDGESDEGYFLKVDVQYPKKFNEFHNDLPSLPERKTIKKENLFTNS